MKTTKCRGCGQEIIFMPTKKGKSMPVDYSTYEGQTYFDPKKNTSHFATCAQAKEFRSESSKGDQK